MKLPTWLNEWKRKPPPLRKREIADLCDMADELDSQWYFDWCERDGSVRELCAFVLKGYLQDGH